MRFFMTDFTLFQTASIGRIFLIRYPAVEIALYERLMLPQDFLYR
jgi:hypothetical protein